MSRARMFKPYISAASLLASTPSSNFLEIDNASKRNLEIVRTLNGEKEGSLLHSVDYTLTSPGKRKLCADLENPLYSFEEINDRLNLVEFF